MPYLSPLPVDGNATVDGHTVTVDQYSRDLLPPKRLPGLDSSIQSLAQLNHPVCSVLCGTVSRQPFDICCGPEFELLAVIYPNRNQRLIDERCVTKSELRSKRRKVISVPVHVTSGT